MPEIDTLTILEQDERLSRSQLWKLQRTFFEQQGIRAWSENIVPSYITSNPFIAHAYGKVVFGFLRDIASTSLDMSQPIYIIELGAGSGRFSYHFLKKFIDLFTRSALKEIPLKYVMTDFSEPLVSFWQDHPSMRPFVEQGFLDFATFDVERPDELTLRHSGTVLSSGTIKNPLVLLANYLCSFIPQDCFTLQDGGLHESLVTLSASEPDAELGLDDPELLDSLEISYTDRAISADYYDDPDFNQILQNYQQRLPDTTFTLPSEALSCLRFFRDLSSDRLLLLCGDQGYSEEEDLLDSDDAADIIMDSGFLSMMVNYHAIGEYVRNRGGQVLHTAHRYTDLYVSAYLLGQDPDSYPETVQAFHEAIEPGGPDDFYTLKASLEEIYDVLSLQQLLVYLRFSGWDSHIFLGCYSVLLERLKEASKAEQHELSRVVQHVWDTYYHIGEEEDLAFSIGVMLYRMEYHAEALDFFQRSMELYDPDQSTFYNMAMCYSDLRRLEEAVACLDEALELFPSFELAKTLRIKFQSQLNRSL